MSQGPTYSFKAGLWLYSGEGAWHFVTLPKDIAQEIKTLFGSSHRTGFGSLKVVADVKGTRWETSIFPDSKSQSYLLPVKKSVRNTLNIGPGDLIEVSVTLKDLPLI